MSPRPTMDEIARLAGVSKPTVSRVLNGATNVAEATKEKVLKVAMEHGYAINRQAQRLRSGEAGVIAVILDFPSYGGAGVSDPFIFDLLSSVSKVLRDQNRDVLITSAPNNDSVDYYLGLVASSVVDGIIFLGRGLREALYSKLSETNLPFVVWGAKLGNEEYCSIGTDGFLGGKKAGQYLISKNRKNILFVGDTRHKEIYARRAGLQAAIKESGLDISVTDLTASNFSDEQTFKAAINLIQSKQTPPDALFAYSDTAAMAFITAFRMADLNVPEDFNVVGYNNIKLSEYFFPALTTLNQDTQLAGKLLVESLDKQLSGGRAESISLDPTLIDRGS